MEKNFPVKIKHLVWVSFILHFLPLAQVYSQVAIQTKTIQLIHTSPVVDGVLDEGLHYLDKRVFKHFWHFDNPTTDTVKMSYRLGYTPSHFYVYIEAEADSITYRDRGFINGDGFKLLFAIPQTDSGTSEYCELVFSPSKDKKYWARKRIWDYNRKQDHGRKLSNETLFEEKVLNGRRCGFEALIAWKDIDPYHPWFLKEMGYNLYFAKAVGNETANGYAEVADEGIWDEEVPLRRYALMKFEESLLLTEPVILARPQRKNLKMGQPIILQTLAIAKEPGKNKLHVVIRKDDSSILSETDITIHTDKKLRQDSFALPTKQLLPNRYRLEISSGSTAIGSYDMSVLPDIKLESLLQEINTNKNRLPIGTVNTLVFKLYQFQQELVALKEYEPGEGVLSRWRSFQQEYDIFLKGIDPYKNITVPYRRAFKSKYDGTYQPYSIKLPKNYDPEKKYPLLVFLHGSGQDEQNLLKEARSDGSFIELAPFARDMYRCYSSDSSQNDIIEAIEDVCKHFSADKMKIVVGGFSMGGYGALRTYFEHPDLYKGVAVFAGHPHLAGDWLGEEHPDFLKDKYLSVFSGVPVFVYHGRKDGALPIQHTEAFLAKLKEKGGIVTARLIDTKAHEYPDEETNNLYFQWLNKIVK